MRIGIAMNAAMSGPTSPAPFQTTLRIRRRPLVSEVSLCIPVSSIITQVLLDSRAVFACIACVFSRARLAVKLFGAKVAVASPGASLFSEKKAVAGVEEVTPDKVQVPA
jgi:hypothetical protein